MFLMAVRAGFVVITLAALYYNFWKSRSEEKQGTRHVRSFDGSSLTTCLVCLNEFDRFSNEQVLALPCRHKYHKECIFQVFENEGAGRKLCPLCRRVVSEEFIRKSS